MLRREQEYRGGGLDQQTLRGEVSEYRVYEHIADGGFASAWIGRDDQHLARGASRIIELSPTGQLQEFAP